jgi:hypothetical protein
VVRGHPVAAQPSLMREDQPLARCELVVSGPVARSVIETITARFGPPSVDRGVLTVEGVDHAAIRALMVLLWDTGHEVLAMSVRERRSNSSTTTRLGTQDRNGTSA